MGEILPSTSDLPLNASLTFMKPIPIHSVYRNLIIFVNTTLSLNLTQNFTETLKRVVVTWRDINWIDAL